MEWRKVFQFFCLAHMTTYLQILHIKLESDTKKIVKFWSNKQDNLITQSNKIPNLHMGIVGGENMHCGKVLSFFPSGGPQNVSVSIHPATALSNGTLIAHRGSNISFNCSGSSYPSQQLTWAFRGASSSNESLFSISGSQLNFKIEDIQPSAQGVYSCRVENPISHQTVNKSTQLLVYCTYHQQKYPEYPAPN